MASSVHYLSINDFGRNGNNVIINVPGLTFVMFETGQCKWCSSFKGEFQNLANTIGNINFALCNLDGANKDIARISKNSTTPITAVPKFILYNEGVPVAEYTSARNSQAILKFLQEMLNTFGQRQTFTSPRQQPSNSMPNRPQAQSQPQQGGGGGQRSDPLLGAFTISPDNGVKEFKTSYGRPYNTSNEMEFIEYENAYKQK